MAEMEIQIGQQQADKPGFPFMTNNLRLLVTTHPSPFRPASPSLFSFSLPSSALSLMMPIQLGSGVPPFEQPSSSSSMTGTAGPSGQVLGASPSNPYQQNVFTRNDRFWLSDGSLVLQAEQTVFRIHKSVLCKHSIFFTDALALPQPAQQEKYEGCPLFRLPDKASDVLDLLDALYYPEHFESLSAERSDLETVLNFITGILRLSTKYLFRSLRSKCISILEGKLPSTLDRFKSHCGSKGAPERHKYSSLIRAVHLARETNVPLCLPYAFYCIARKGPHRIMAGPRERGLKRSSDTPISTPNGTPSKSDHRDSGDEDDEHSDAETLELSWRDRAWALAGREQLRRAEACLTHSFLIAFESSARCTFLVCRASQAPHSEWHRIEQAKHPDPLRLYTRWIHMNVCQECIEHCTNKHERGRKETWRMLAQWFGFGSWDELRTLQDR